MRFQSLMLILCAVLQAQCSAASTPGQVYNGTVVPHACTEYQYNTTSSQSGQFVSVSVEARNATAASPVVVVVRQQNAVDSIVLPVTLSGCTFSNYTQTVCFAPNSQLDETIYVELTGNSPEPYSIVGNVLDVMVQVGQSKQRRAGVNNALYFYFNLTLSADNSGPNGPFEIRIESDSEDVVGIASLLKTNCPNYQPAQGAFVNGRIQTLTTKAAFYLSEADASTAAWFLGLAVLPTGGNCQAVKHFTVSITPTMDTAEYAGPVIGIVFIYVAFLFAVSLVFLFARRHVLDSTKLYLCKTDGTFVVLAGEIGAVKSQTELANEGSRLLSGTSTTPQSMSTFPTATAVEVAAPPEDFDMVDDSDRDPEILRLGSSLTVQELTRDEVLFHEGRLKRYLSYIGILAMFYFLPVIQFVIGYEEVFSLTGNEDFCYFNFYCTRPYSVFYHFNNVFSNIGYIILGLSFMGIVKCYQVRYNVQKAKVTKEQSHLTECGLPPHYSLYYTIGAAIFLEGIFSACFHVCPAAVVFQFDTSFMYILACLMGITVYYKRHADLQSSPSRVYGFMAFIIFTNVIGVYFADLAFWLVMSFIFYIIVLCMSAQIYYYGTWKIDTGLPGRIWHRFRHDRIPHNRAKFIFIAILNLFNITIFIVGLVLQTDFATFLLAVLIVNLLVYFSFYIVMKMVRREHLSILTIIFSVAATAFWIPSLYYFTRATTNFNLPPAESRAGNENCVMFNFYDVHDVWHFLSAAALFFSALVVFTMDHNLNQVPRKHMEVF